MPLKLVKRHGGEIWYLRGSIRGIRVDQSTGTSNEKVANEVRIKTEAQLLERSVHGDIATRTFNEAAVVYMKGGGECEVLEPIIKRIGKKKLFEINQSLIEETAEKLYPNAGPATRNRKVFTPISAVMHTAARKHWCPKPVIARPRQPEGRIRWVEHDTAQALISSAAPHLAPLVTFLFSTGCRIGEALALDWEQVNITEGTVHFLKTKNGCERYVAMPPKAVAALANLPHKGGAVFRTQKGVAYKDRKGEGGGEVKTSWRTMCKTANVSNFSPHDCRHTFATWYLRANPEDYRGLMKQGGWKSVSMVMRYAHINVDDVKPRVASIWGKVGDKKTARKPKPKPAKVS